MKIKYIRVLAVLSMPHISHLGLRSTVPCVPGSNPTELSALPSTLPNNDQRSTMVPSVLKYIFILVKGKASKEMLYRLLFLR